MHRSAGHKPLRRDGSGGTEAWDSPSPRLLEVEIVKDEPGQAVVLDRLLDLLLVAVLRSWFSRSEAEAPAWYRALGDPLVGHALRLLHADPATPWTVATLASATGASRAGLARRFTELVGEPPMTFLAGWRLDVAADLLREPDLTIGAVARKVGYGSSFALSTAFKRVHGVSPAKYRVGLTKDEDEVYGLRGHGDPSSQTGSKVEVRQSGQPSVSPV